MTNSKPKRLEQKALRDLKTTYTIHHIGGEVDLAKHRALQAKLNESEAKKSIERWTALRAKVIEMVEKQESVLRFTHTEKEILMARKKQIFKLLIDNQYSYQYPGNSKLTFTQRASNWIAKLWRDAFRA